MIVFPTSEPMDKELATHSSKKKRYDTSPGGYGIRTIRDSPGMNPYRFSGAPDDLPQWQLDLLIAHLHVWKRIGRILDLMFTSVILKGRVVQAGEAFPVSNDGIQKLANTSRFDKEGERNFIISRAAVTHSNKRVGKRDRLSRQNAVESSRLFSARDG